MIEEDVAAATMPNTAVMPPLSIDEPGFLEAFEQTFGDELTEEASKDLEELLATQNKESEDAVRAAWEITENPISTKPGINKMVRTGNGLYLPVRQRIVWMRGEPEPHPEWLINTSLEAFEPGKVNGVKAVFIGGEQKWVPQVEGGFAVFKAEVVKPDGDRRLVIGEGTAMERSEGFFDFVEKAETAAIGRALAVAGYGTESATDLDEGVNEGNLADAPVRLPAAPEPPVEFHPHVNGDPAAIHIEPSNIPNVRQGGRQTKATTAQIAAIRDRARDLMLSPSGLQTIIREALPEGQGSFYEDDVEDNPDGSNLVLGFLADLSFEACGKVVLALAGRGQSE